MLTKINHGRVESDTGFSIHIIGLEQLKYEENGRSIIFEWNYDPSKRKTLIFVSGDKKLNEVEKKRIINNIREAVKLLEGNFEVI